MNKLFFLTICALTLNAADIMDTESDEESISPVIREEQVFLDRLRAEINTMNSYRVYDALINAVHLERESAVEFLLSARPWQTGQDQGVVNRSLGYAAIQGCIPIMALLITRADQSGVNNALGFSAMHRRLSSITYLLTHPGRLRPDHHAIMELYVEAFESANHQIVNLLRPYVPENAWQQEMATAITDQEAIVASSTYIIGAYRQMTESPETAELINDFLLDPKSASISFAEIAPLLGNQLHAICSLQPKLKIRFRTEQAIRALNLLNGDSTIEHHPSSRLESYQNYSMSDFPNIRQLFVLAYRLMTKEIDLSQFIKVWLAENFIEPDAWNRLKVGTFSSDLPHLNLILRQPTIGSALELDEDKGSPFVNEIVQIISSTSKHDELVLPNKQLVSLSKAYFTHLNEMLNPLIDGLFMIMRGHNTVLTEPSEENKPACAQGAYIGMIKAICEIPSIQRVVGGVLEAIEITECEAS